MRSSNPIKMNKALIIRVAMIAMKRQSIHDGKKAPAKANDGPENTGLGAPQAELEFKIKKSGYNSD